MRLNLGCGDRKLPGWLNVDSAAGCDPDAVVDLETLPWPWPDNSAEEVLLSHVLEHLGAQSSTYLKIIQELYRVCRDGAKIVIRVPHPRHDFFLNDPTHVRAIMPEGLAMFSQAENRRWMAMGVSNTPLALYLNVDFAIESVNLALDEPWRSRHEKKEISEADLRFALRHYNNVASEFEIALRAVKPQAAL